MKIKLTDLNDRTSWAYLKQNPEYANKLVATLNQVDGFSSNEFRFYANSAYWTYDYWFSPNYEIYKEGFRILNDQIHIISTNRDDLLNPHYYQQLNDLANNYHLVEEWKWSYYVQDQVLQLEVLLSSWFNPYINIKLTKPIDQYDQKQLNTMGKLMTNVHDLIIKDKKLDWDQFADQWKQGFDLDDVCNLGIVFDLNDFTNPKLLIRWEDGNYNDHYENNDLKQVLKSDSELLKFLNNNNFQAEFQDYQSKANKFFKRLLDV